MNRGWISVDLHMHGPGSKKVDNNRIDQSMSASTFVNTLKSNGIQLFSITDHMCFDSDFYDKIEKEIKDDNAIKLLYGCELNVYITKDPEKGSSKNKFQMGVYFNPSLVEKSKLEQAIINLYGDSKIGGDFPKNKPSLHEIIQELSKLNTPFILLPEANKKGGIDDLNNTLFVKDLESLFRNIMYRFFNGYDSTENWSQKNMEIWALEFVKNSDEINKIFGNMSDDEIRAKIQPIYSYLKNNTAPSDKKQKELFTLIKNYAKNFCYFSFSDWHNKEPYSKKRENYIYGDLDQPFETVRVATMDPFSRVRIENVGEKITINHSFIKKVSFECSGREVEVDFEPELNAIIGKRASGKSLLLSAIKYLKSKNVKDEETTIIDYEKHGLIKSESIKAITYGNTEFGPGNLQNVEVISQNTITKIFNDPESGSEIFSGRFPQLPAIKRDNFNSVVDLAKSLKQFESNYGLCNDYIFNESVDETLLIKPIKELSLANLIERRNNLLSSFNSYVLSIKSLGFRTNALEKTGNLLKNQIDDTEWKIAKYKKMIESINLEISKQNAMNEEKIERSTIALNNLNKSLEGIFKTFDNLLNFKKFKYAINNFKLDIPTPDKSNVGEYVFLSYCSFNNEAIKNGILEIVTSNINKTGVKKKDDEWSIIGEYLDGNTRLNNNKKTLADGLDDTYWSTVAKTTKKLFRDDRIAGDKKELDVDDLKKMASGEPIEGIVSISDSSLGAQSSAYLEILLKQSDSAIMLFDQPEDNIDNDYISSKLVPMIKAKKINKQFIFVTHNPSVAVYADAFNYIYAENSDGVIQYRNLYLEDEKSREDIITILDGGKPSFSNRNRKYGDVIGEMTWKLK